MRSVRPAGRQGAVDGYPGFINFALPFSQMYGLTSMWMFEDGTSVGPANFCGFLPRLGLHSLTTQCERLRAVEGHEQVSAPGVSVS